METTAEAAVETAAEAPTVVSKERMQGVTLNAKEKRLDVNLDASPADVLKVTCGILRGNDMGEANIDYWKSRILSYDDWLGYLMCVDDALKTVEWEINCLAEKSL